MNELRQLMFNPAFWFGAFVSLVISIIAGIIVVYGQDRFTKRAAIRQAALEKHIKELEQHTETIVSSHAIMQVQALTLYYIESIRKLVTNGVGLKTSNRARFMPAELHANRLNVCFVWPYSGFDRI